MSSATEAELGMYTSASRSYTTAPAPHRNGPSTTTHPHLNGQLHSPGCCQQHSPTKLY
eukprot:CCRYP_001447-RC/>CCRYP_001447-RC protein AED:0.28 eAED:1.00 QI:0/-1/0/1/-1/0/1/0/57